VKASFLFSFQYYIIGKDFHIIREINDNIFMQQKKSYPKWMKNIFLGGIFAISNLVIYLIYEIITSDIDYYFNKRDPYFLYMIVSSILFPIFLFLFEYRKKRKYFYLFFYSCWHLLTLVIISIIYSYFEIIYSDGYIDLVENKYIISLLAENIITFVIIGVIYILTFKPLNLIFLLSFFLLKKYRE
jgi:hypothetical protein